jgi:hypothetical protein
VHRPAYSPRSSSTPMGYTITPLTPHTGAEVPGIDLNEGVDAETRATLNRAFCRTSCADGPRSAIHPAALARGTRSCWDTVP